MHTLEKKKISKIYDLSFLRNFKKLGKEEEIKRNNKKYNKSMLFQQESHIEKPKPKVLFEKINKIYNLWPD